MSGLQSTQPTPDIPAIFLKPDGSPLSVFTQAEDVLGRPRIAKLLKKGGAIISKDPKDADIVLVNDDSETGKQFIRVWSNDGHKVVLRYQWVSACVTARKILREADNWGDYVTLDDGQPIEDNFSETEQPSKSPLPTPRQSPVDPPAPALSTLPSKLSPLSTTKVTLVGGELPLTLPPVPSTSPDWTSEDEVSPSNVVGTQKQAANKSSTRSPSPLIQDDEISPSVKFVVSEQGKGKQQAVPRSPRETSAAESNLLFMPTVGKPLKFYVQVGFPKRIDLVSTIKKHGGMIDAHIGLADYAILYANSITNPKDYQHLLNSAISAGRPAINSQFISDCIARGRVLDPEAYAFAPQSKKRKRKSISVQSGSEDDEEPMAKKLKPMKVPAPSQSVKPSKPPSKVKGSQATEHLPSKRRASAVSKPVNKYTEFELDFALQEAFNLFKHDHNASDSQLAIILHSKMGEHTLASWRTLIGQTKRLEFQEARKRGSIQFRKKMALGGPLPELIIATDEEDIETFADFLAFHGGDDENSDRLAPYKALEARAPWRSAEGWQEFWGTYNEEISALYNIKLEEQ